MARIDMIPVSWRERRRVRRMLRGFAFALGASLLLIFAARLFIAGRMLETSMREERLGNEKRELDSAMSANRTAYDRLKKLKQVTGRLEVNRGVSITENILSPLDADLSAGVKLESLIATVGDRGAKGNGAAHLALFGSANDAAHLSEFTERMTAHAHWQHLKMGRIAPARSGKGIDFSLEIDIVPPRAGDSR